MSALLTTRRVAFRVLIRRLGGPLVRMCQLVLLEGLLDSLIFGGLHVKPTHITGAGVLHLELFEFFR